MPDERLFTGREISEFLLRACHDLRSPLRAIRTQAELLARSGDAPHSTGSGSDPRLAFLIEGAAKMDRLVDELAGYSIALRIDPGSFMPTPLGVLLRSVLAKLEKELRENRAEVTYGDLPRVAGEADRLMQLFENLLRHRGQVSRRSHIAASPHAEGWLITVQDNGPDIEAADLERIFKPFTPGLGLAACREIVERHGGRIWAESQPGAGCTFLFTLPAADTDF
jgi:signal transduction histidine kinase